MSEKEAIESLAGEIEHLEHRARCNKHKQLDEVGIGHSVVNCIHSSRESWNERLLEARGTIIRDRPRVLESETIQAETGLGRLYITIGFESNEPFEVFCHISTAGGQKDAEAEQIKYANGEEVARLVSLCLRAGIPISEIISQLRGIKGPTPVRWETKLVYGIGDAVGFVLSKYIEDEE